MFIDNQSLEREEEKELLQIDHSLQSWLNQLIIRIYSIPTRHGKVFQVDELIREIRRP